MEALASTFFQETELFFRLPGRSSALSENAEQWERSSLDVVNVAGCSRDVFVCQHPIFDFRFLPNFENRKVSVAWNLHTEIANFLVISEACCSFGPLPAPRSAAMSRVIGAPHFPVNPPKRQKRHFLNFQILTMWKTLLSHQ